MKQVVIRNIKGEAKAWLHSQVDFMLKSYSELIRNLKECFDRPINAFEVRMRLKRRTWTGKFETLADCCQA